MAKIFGGTMGKRRVHYSVIAVLLILILIPLKARGEGYYFVNKWGSDVSSNGKFKLPRWVTGDRFGNIYVVDTYNKRIQKFDTNGTFIKKWGSYGMGDGSLLTQRGWLSTHQATFILQMARIPGFRNSTAPAIL